MTSSRRPNFLIMVADDLGFSDTSPYGSEISTPNLSRMAKDGLRMTDFHTAAACSPTRSMLLSGTDNHIAGLGQMAEFMKSDGFWIENDRFIDRKKDLPKDFYSSDYFTTHLLRFLEERTDKEKSKPFFGYLAFTAPHWPLQAPRAVIDKYKGAYDDGPDALRLRRLAQLQRLGLVPEGIIPAVTREWQQLSADERRESARKMETYVAMVDQMDENVGRVLDYIEKTGELDNTFVLFMSDNGAEGNLLESLPVMSSLGVAETMRRFYNNSLDNIGNHDSFVWYGPRWALAATAPSRGFKGTAAEGGIRCPCIVRYPRAMLSNGGITHEFTNVMDILPTFLELAQVQHPAPMFRGHEVAPVSGKSWMPLLSGMSPFVYDTKQDVSGWELFDKRAIRRGEYKALLMPPPEGSGEWELYNLTTDPGEINNLANEKPEILRALLDDWEQYFSKTGIVEIDFGDNSITAM
ncbi:arylsulfatase [Fusarium bulbicola]|nr:arylsulfatase [Fusarium bulbicola]